MCQGIRKQKLKQCRDKVCMHAHVWQSIEIAKQAPTFHQEMEQKWTWSRLQSLSSLHFSPLAAMPVLWGAPQALRCQSHMIYIFGHKMRRQRCSTLVRKWKVLGFWPGTSFGLLGGCKIAEKEHPLKAILTDIAGKKFCNTFSVLPRRHSSHPLACRPTTRASGELTLKIPLSTWRPGNAWH